MKKLLLLTIIAITVSFLAIPSFTPVAEAVKLQNATFDVSDYLNVDGQEQAYFSTDPKIHEHKVPIVSFILTLINFALRVMGSIAIIILIVGGFMLMIARGNQQKLDEAKEIFEYALIGLVVAFLAYIIVIFVQSIFISSGQS